VKQDLTIATMLTITSNGGCLHDFLLTQQQWEELDRARLPDNTFLPRPTTRRNLAPLPLIIADGSSKADRALLLQHHTIAYKL
jgi:hypothetical protein